jgi:hypothetical protein
VWSKRIKETLAVIAIGDGAIEVLAPKRHSLLWDTGPDGVRAVARYFARNPNIMRLLGAAQIAFGVWLALRQYED